jgi:hypothetical protein
MRSSDVERRPAQKHFAQPAMGIGAHDWRARAEEARMLANQMNDSESRDAMLRIAEDYERLAKRAEDRTVGRLPNREMVPRRLDIRRSQVECTGQRVGCAHKYYRWHSENHESGGAL